MSKQIPLNADLHWTIVWALLVNVLQDQSAEEFSAFGTVAKVFAFFRS